MVKRAQEASHEMHKGVCKALRVVGGAFDAVSHAKLDEMDILVSVIFQCASASLLSHEPQNRQQPHL